jgi:hypothetical protein
MEWSKQLERSPSHTKKLISQVRKIWLYARSKDLVDFVPSIKAPAEFAKANSRRKLKEDEFKKMFEYSLKRYEKASGAQRFKDSFLQFHCWLVICSHTGIRPPAHLKNAIKWEHYKPGAEGEFSLLHRENEKELAAYDAIVLPGAEEAFSFLEELYLKREMGKPKYLFSHTHATKGTARSPGHKKGQVILSYRKQWITMLRELGLESTETAQRLRLAPYSLRGYFHTQIMEKFPEIRMEQIAAITGTSSRMLEQSYVDYDSERIAKQISSLMNKP